MKQSKASRRKMQQQGNHVYVLTNADHSLFYVGATAVIAFRVKEHLKKTLPESFTAKYDCNKLVYYKKFNLLVEAKDEERRIKALGDDEKKALIETMNAGWEDLTPGVDFL